jgi:acyl-coenzyme A thioesterase PaaI-like protein
MDQPTTDRQTSLAEAPAGFRRFEDFEGFIGLTGPYWWRDDGTGVVDYGFRADRRHGNPNGVLHGGCFTTFMDTVLGYEVIRVTGRRCATIALDTKFLSSGVVGDWVLGRVKVRRITGSMAFIDGEVFAGDKLVVLVTAVFRVFSPDAAPVLLPGGPGTAVAS